MFEHDVFAAVHLDRPLALETFFGGSVADCACMTRCFASFSKYPQPSAFEVA